MASSTSQALRFNTPGRWPAKVLRLSVAGGPRAPERVRAWIQSAVLWLPKDVQGNLLLLTCELVNNSVLHGQSGEGDVIEVELCRTADGVRAQVSDSGPGFDPCGRDRGIDEPGGWGLVLVDRMAARWGVDHEDGTSVWFELARA